MTALLAAYLITACVVWIWTRQAKHQLRRETHRARDEILQAHQARLHDLAALQRELAHTLGNALTGIKGVLALISLEPGRAPERLEVLHQGVSQMEAILREYLSFSRPALPLAVEPMDVGATVRWVAQLHSSMASTKRITLDVSRVDPVVMRGDPQRVKQSLSSLVANAVEASPPSMSIELSCRREEDHVVVAVLDHGPGVADEKLTRMMEAGVTTKQGRTGLGLTMARAIAAQHGGEFRLCNQKGGGFAAELILPLECPEQRGRPLA